MHGGEAGGGVVWVLGKATHRWPLPLGSACRPCQPPSQPQAIVSSADAEARCWRRSGCGASGGAGVKPAGFPSPPGGALIVLPQHGEREGSDPT